MTKVSVIIPTYKRASMLTRAIESVLNQTYKNIEIIVIDDNNPDSQFRRETAEIMDVFKDNPKVRYIQHEKNKNGAAARNTGIINSTGEVITFLDDDDWYQEEKIMKQVNYLKNNNKYKAVYCGWFRNGEAEIPKLKGNLSYELLSGELTIRTNTIMIWKKELESIDGWNEEFIRNQEAALLLKFFKSGYEIGVVEETLVYYDLSDRSNALTPSLNKRQFEFHLKWHKDIIEDLEKDVWNAKKKIFSNRYRAILFEYILKRDYKGAFKHYIDVSRTLPIYFNKSILIYLFNKLVRR